MPEQLGFEKRFGDPGAIDGDEFLLSAQRVGVDMTRDHVLADSAFARDQDFRVAARGALGEFQELAHLRARDNRGRGAIAGSPGLV